MQNGVRRGLRSTRAIHGRDCTVNLFKWWKAWIGRIDDGGNRVRSRRDYTDQAYYHERCVRLLTIVSLARILRPRVYGGESLRMTLEEPTTGNALYPRSLFVKNNAVTVQSP